MAETKLRRILITVHGIRSFGQWQTRLGSQLQSVDPTIEVFAYRYGYFSVFAFLLPPLRWLVTRRFRRELQRVATMHSASRIDIVAHSFGTHLVGWGILGLRKDRRPRVHTIILAGSVLKPQFPWGDLLQDGSVYRVVNECGTRDTVLVLNQIFVLFTGMAGRFGFAGMTSERFQNRYHRAGHSGFFTPDSTTGIDFMERRWVPLLTLDTPVPEIDERAAPGVWSGMITTLLQHAEPIKLAVYCILLLIPGAVYYQLYRDAESARAQAEAEVRRHKVSKARLLDTLVWVINESAHYEFDHSDILASDTEKRTLVRGAVERIVELGFRGRMTLEGHVGSFQVVDNENESPRLATSNDRHRRINGSLGYNLAFADRIAGSVMQIVQEIAHSDSIQVIGVSYGSEKPVERYPDWSAVEEWNRIAKRNNNVRIVLDGSIP